MIRLAEYTWSTHLGISSLLYFLLCPVIGSNKTTPIMSFRISTPLYDTIGATQYGFPSLSNSKFIWSKIWVGYLNLNFRYSLSLKRALGIYFIPFFSFTSFDSPVMELTVIYPFMPSLWLVKYFIIEAYSNGVTLIISLL